MVDQQTEQRTLRANIRELPRAAWVIVAGTFLNRFGSFAAVFLVLFLPSQRGFTLAQAGTALAAYGVGALVAGPVGGYLADRAGRPQTLALAMASSALAMAGLYFAHPYRLVVVIAFLAGVVSEAYRPAATAFLADIVPGGRRVTVFAVLRTAANLGFALGSMTAGFIAVRSYGWVFGADITSSVVFASLAVLALPRARRPAWTDAGPEGSPLPQTDDPPPPPSRRLPGGAHARPGYLTALRDRPLMLFLGAWTLIAFIIFQEQGGLPLQVRLEHLPVSDYGLLLAANGAVVVFLELPISSWTMRRTPQAMNALSFVLVGIGFGLTGLTHSFAALLGTVLIWTVGEMVGAPVGSAYISDLAPPRLRGRYVGLYELFGNIGFITGPAIGLALFAASPKALWVVCGAVGGVAALLALAGRPAAAG